VSLVHPEAAAAVEAPEEKKERRMRLLAPWSISSLDVRDLEARRT
jgi:hypothetical protein